MTDPSVAEKFLAQRRGERSTPISSTLPQNDLPPVRDGSIVCDNRNRSLEDPPTFRSEMCSMPRTDSDDDNKKHKKEKKHGLGNGILLVIWLLIGVASVVTTYHNMYRTKSCKIEMNH